MQGELKPCPFCGDAMRGADRVEDGSASGPGLFHVTCDCGAMGVGGSTVAGAVAAWNRRATDGQTLCGLSVAVDENVAPGTIEARIDGNAVGAVHGIGSADGQRAGVPEGWKLVPVEPTPDMRAAAAAAYLDHHGYGDAWIVAVHRAMIAAARTPPAGDAERDRRDAAIADALHYVRMGNENLALKNGVHTIDFANAERILVAAIAASKEPK